MSKYTILLDGSLSVTKRLRQQLTNSEIIAADGGIRHAKALNLKPQSWLGDFDSAEPSLQQYYGDIPQTSFPREKDKTDGELAIDKALGKGADELVLCGAFGGKRIDHSLLHMSHAIALAKGQISCLLTDGTTEGYPLIKGQYNFDFPKKTIFSIIGFADIKGLTIRGAKWQLENAQLKLGSSLALSNENEGKIQISLQSGYGILLAKLNL